MRLHTACPCTMRIGYNKARGHGTSPRSFGGSVSLLAAYRRTSPVLGLHVAHKGVVLSVVFPASPALTYVWGTAVKGA
ncbi:hypothetical protein E2C01_067740 [Portunus trituberculatus]|uniref:Uncharacterized protein n=1 Tax=Portunus trituberculatus TaxID=210409 RepID=A0A5B7HQ45_PORTR|nr:hypothetical protein [Portunus trituberculatus]